MPYGLQHLRGHFDLRYTDAHRIGPWRHRVPRAMGGVARRLTPGLQGTVGAAYALRRYTGSDIALSVFENTGLGFQRLQRLSQRGMARMPHVMLACWLAEDCQRFTASQRRSVRRSLRDIDRLLVFSQNQVAILRVNLGLAADRIGVVPFGIDSRFYDAAGCGGRVGGAGVVAIGRDRHRDYRTLIEAVRRNRMPLTLVCYPENIAGIDPPPWVSVRSGISHDEYRCLLLAADLVVTPTVAPAYPCGQSVLLEAMSIGAATLTTDSLAIREYVTDGTDGALVAPRDPDALAARIAALMADSEEREAMGTAAARTVRARFGLEHLWGAVAVEMAAVLAKR